MASKFGISFALQVFYEISMVSGTRQEEDAPMETTLPPTRPAWEHRLHAVLALLGGEPLPQVTARFGIGRSVLYKWRHRALTALQGALTDHRPGPHCPANRLSRAREQPLVALAQRHPTWSAAQIQAQAGPEAPSSRTIQRLRHRYQLPRLPKRPAPCRPARRLTGEVKQEAHRRIETKPRISNSNAIFATVVLVGRSHGRADATPALPRGPHGAGAAAR
jgi:transposase